MWCVWGKQEHIAFGDYYIFEFAVVNDFKDHGAAILVEPFGGLIYMVVGSGIRPTYYLGILLEPKVQ